MNRIKYCIVAFSLVLSNLVYSENKVIVSMLDVVDGNSTVLSKGKDSSNCSKENAEKIVRALPEVAEAQTRIESLTNNEKGISIMYASRSIKGISYHAFQVGFNGSDNFETYYFFLVNQDNSSDVRVLDIISGDLKSIVEWRKKIN